MNFPSNPTNGQEYTYGDQTWRWSSATSTWDLVALASVSLDEALAARDEAVAAANLAVSSLALKANIGSPAFTGTPTAPTATPGTGTTQLATTAFVAAAVAANGFGLTNGDKGDITVASNGASFTIDAGAVTLAKMANLAAKTYIGRTTNSTGAPEAVPVATLKADLGLDQVSNTSDANKPVSTAQQAALDLKANLASPALTGTPTAPTAAGGTSTTQIATTAFASAAAIAAASASWIDYTPTVTAGSGTITTLGTLNCSYCQRSLQKAVDIRVSVVITTNGTAGTLINVSLPVAARSGRTFVMAGREAGVNGKMLQGVVVGSTLSVVNFDNTYPGLDGATLILSGTYEIA